MRMRERNLRVFDERRQLQFTRIAAEYFGTICVINLRFSLFCSDPKEATRCLPKFMAIEPSSFPIFCA
jgi:hypothetical protein